MSCLTLPDGRFFGTPAAEEYGAPLACRPHDDRELLGPPRTMQNSRRISRSQSAGHAPERKSQRSVILFAYGISSRTNLVSSLRKDCRWEVDAGTTPCGAPGDLAHQRRSLDVES